MTTAAMIVRADDLREGDLMCVGGTTYVLVAKAEVARGLIDVTLYNGCEPQDHPTYTYEPDHEVRLAQRTIRLSWPRRKAR
jgi:hypothetical protein